LSPPESRQAILSADERAALRRILQPHLYRRVLEAMTDDDGDAAQHEDRPPLGAWLKAELLRRHWSQKRLADAVGTTPGRMSEWINGKVRPEPESCEKLAAALNADPEVVLRRAGHVRVRPYEDDDERVASLIVMLRKIDLSDDRYSTLWAGLNAMLETDARQRQPEDEAPDRLPPVPPRQDHPVRRRPPRTPR